MTRKGDHIPKEDRGEGTGWKKPYTTRPEKRNQVEGAAPTWIRAVAVRTNASRSHSVSQRQRNRTKTKSKSNQGRESNVTIVDRARTQTIPETGGQTCRLCTAPNPRGQKDSSSPMACQQVPDKDQGNNYRSGATEVGQLRKNLNHPEPAANTGSEKDEPRQSARKNRRQDHPTARDGSRGRGEGVRNV